MPQLSEYEREKIRRQDKKKKVINTRSQAVAATAVGVSWLTAGIATGGLVIAGTLVAAGVTVGSMGGTARCNINSYPLVPLHYNNGCML